MGSSMRRVPVASLSSSARSTAAPTVGWPANGISWATVKMRMRARFALFFGGSTNTVSETLNSRAICCMAASSSPWASRTTASGLPPKGRVVNTSRVTYRRGISALERYKSTRAPTPASYSSATI